MNDGCQGGSANTGFKYIETDGLPFESCAPYVSGIDGHDHKCERDAPCAGRFYCEEHSTFRIKDSDWDSMKTELSTNGPMYANFFVYEDFYCYSSGVYKHVLGDEMGGHAVKMIGWGTDPVNGDYWLL